MKKIFRLFLLSIVVLLVSGCKNENYLNEISYNEYLKLLESKETFILEVMRTECTACVDFSPKLESVAKKYNIEIKVINTDNLSEEEYGTFYNTTGIEGTPTVLFYKKGEEETTAARITGSVSEEKIISKFKSSGFIDE